MIEFIRQHLLHAGALCRQGQQTLAAADIERKGPKDLVTAVDRSVERYLVERIVERFPGHDIIGEEEGERLSGADWCWIIDPIDGTTSFCRGQAYYAVSIGLSHNNLYYLNLILPHIFDLRRCGSAALDLAYVAAGKVDGFWELNLNLYDIAAGVLLVREAGGVVTDFFGGADFPGRGIVAGNGSITAELLAFTGRA